MSRQHSTPSINWRDTRACGYDAGNAGFKSLHGSVQFYIFCSIFLSVHPSAPSSARYRNYYATSSLDGRPGWTFSGITFPNGETADPTGIEYLEGYAWSRFLLWEVPLVDLRSRKYLNVVIFYLRNQLYPTRFESKLSLYGSRCAL